MVIGEKDKCLPCSNYIYNENNFFCCFWIDTRCLLFIYMYQNHLIILSEIRIIKKATSYVTIPQTSSNFSKVFICFCIILDTLVKKYFPINHDIVMFWFYIWKKITFTLWWVYYLYMTIQKFIFIPSKPGSIKWC